MGRYFGVHFRVRKGTLKETTKGCLTSRLVNSPPFSICSQSIPKATTRKSKSLGQWPTYATVYTDYYSAQFIYNSSLAL